MLVPVMTLILAAEVGAFAMLPRTALGGLVLLLAVVIPVTVAIALLVRRRLNSNALRRIRRISPEDITDRRPRSATSLPEDLSRSIVERAREIRRTLADSPSSIQIEMCVLGYRNCANDMITLTHMINEEIPDAGFFRRLRLRACRRRATDALSEARAALPPGVLRATRQEQQ